MRQYAVLLSTETIRHVERLSDGILAYGANASGKYLRYRAAFQCADRSYIIARLNERSLEFKFDCSALALSSQPEKPFDLLPSNRSALKEVRVLVREEWIKSVSAKEVKTIGNKPMLQSYGRLGTAPPTAVAKCLVASGLQMVFGDGHSLVVNAGDTPLTVDLFDCELAVREVLGTHESMTLEEYLHRFGAT